MIVSNDSVCRPVYKRPRNVLTYSFVVIAVLVAIIIVVFPRYSSILGYSNYISLPLCD